VHREELIGAARDTLAHAGFYVSKPLNMRSISFDVVARRDASLLIVKILSNVDALSKENAEEMKTLAEALQASPLIIGERSGTGEVEEGIVYSRFSIPIVSLHTLKDLLLEGVPPFIFAAPGGLYVKLDSEVLKKLREEKSISLGTLADVAGVSRRTIQMYEAGMGAMIEVALRLEEYLNQPLVKPVDPLDFKHTDKELKKAVDLTAFDDFSRQVFRDLVKLGFSVTPTTKCPFEALSKERGILVLTGLGQDESKLGDKARVVGDISKITEQRSVIFIERIRNRESIGGMALVGKDELMKLDESEKFYEMVNQRTRVREKAQ
jgi:putative transcriptional regulator